jgi:predicted DNA-binding transcriptional regulator AlpA
MNKNELMSLIDVCNFLDISIGTLFNLRKYDPLFPKPCKTINKRKVFFLKGDILE